MNVHIEIVADSPNRRSFIGSTRSSRVMTRPPYFAPGGKSATRSNPRTSPATSSSSSARGSPYLRFLTVSGFRRRTPGPPPFWSMNSMPAVSKAKRILVPVSSRPPKGPSRASSRFIVGIDTSAAAANCSCDQANRALAALICLIDTFSIDRRGI
jgi:hypothetical protein